MNGVAEYKAGVIKHAGTWFKLRVDDEGNWLTEFESLPAHGGATTSRRA